jgi:hypothetical protein
MSFKEDILAALQGGQDHQVLLDIVRRHHAQGLTPNESYNQLQQIWQTLGFDEAEETSPAQDELEFVMERVWYQGSRV